MSPGPNRLRQPLHRRRPCLVRNCAREQACAGLLDHLIGACEHGRRNVEAKRLGRFHVDHHLVRRLLDRQIGRLGALQNLVHKASRSSPTVTQINAIAQQSTSLDKLTVGVDHRQPRGCRQRHNLSALTDKQPIGWQHYQFDMLTRQSLERSIEIARPMGLGPYKLERECAGSGLEVSPVDQIRLIAGMYHHTDRLRARQISSASSICFAAKLSDEINMPVTWPPGRARLAAKPKPTGSVNEAPTIGIVTVARFTSRIPAVVPVRMTSGLRSTNC